MKRGDVYWAQLSPRSGAEQRGRRPIVIVSHDGFNETPSWQSIIIVPLSTSKLQAKRAPTAPHIPKGSAGIKQESVALCHQVTTLDRSKLIEHIGRLSNDRIASVDQGLRAAMCLD